MTTLPDAISPSSPHTALILPSSATSSKTSLHIPYTRLTRDILLLQQKFANLGITHASAVSIALPNSYAFIVSFLAAASQRGIAAPLNPAYKQSEFEFYIDDLSSALALVPKGAVAADAPAVRAARKYNAAIAECWFDELTGRIELEVKDLGKLKGQGPKPVERARPADVALVLHTSGTTGRPKAVPLSHRNLCRTMRNIKATYQLTEQDRTMLVMPLFHVHGLLAGFLAPLFSGGSAIVPAGFSASTFWKDFVENGATWYTAVPTLHQILLKGATPKPLPNIRFIRSCSSPLSPKVFGELEARYKAPVLEAYAMTEAAHQMTSNPLPPSKRVPGMVGIGHGVEVRILDAQGQELERGKEGEICARGENITAGYLNNPEANKSSFTAEGFFRTGDQGKMDEDGYVMITGRIKELINKGGEKISPIELDNQLAQHSAVSEAVSFAIEDEMYGQDVGVAVVLKPDGKLGADELKEWMKERVAKFKVPKQVFFTDTMPKTATGKIQRRMVAEAMLKQGQPKAKL